MSNAPPPLTTRLLAEGIGSAFLVVAVIGSGIMAETLSPTDVGLQLLENSAATAGALIGLIIMFATVSGAHFNPAVTLVERLLGRMNNIEAASYVGAQLLGGWARWGAVALGLGGRGGRSGRCELMEDDCLGRLVPVSGEVGGDAAGVAVIFPGALVSCLGVCVVCAGVGYGAILDRLGLRH